MFAIDRLPIVPSVFISSFIALEDQVLSVEYANNPFGTGKTTQPKRKLTAIINHKYSVYHKEFGRLIDTLI